MLSLIKNSLNYANKNRRAIATLLTLTSALTLVGCKVYLTRESVESALQEGFVTYGVTLNSITCPDEIEAVAGLSYTCTGYTPDVTYTIAVEPTGEGTTFNWRVAQLTLVGDAVAREVRAGLEAQISITLDSVTCPTEIIAEAGRVYECIVTAGNEVARVEVTPTGEGSSFDWALKQG